MRLEAGKKYKLRNGNVERCLAVWSEEFGGYQATMTCAFDIAKYTIDGWFIRSKKEHDLDVVAEYREPKKHKVKVYLWSDGKLYQDSDRFVVCGNPEPYCVETREIEWEAPDNEA